MIILHFFHSHKKNIHFILLHYVEAMCCRLYGCYKRFHYGILFLPVVCYSTMHFWIVHKMFACDKGIRVNRLFRKHHHKTTKYWSLGHRKLCGIYYAAFGNQNSPMLPSITLNHTIRSYPSNLRLRFKAFYLFTNEI